MEYFSLVYDGLDKNGNAINLRTVKISQKEFIDNQVQKQLLLEKIILMGQRILV